VNTRRRKKEGKMDKRSLPKLVELHKDPEEAFKNDELNSLLNAPPHSAWVKSHPFAKVKNDANQNVPARYIPIDKIEFLLTRIFQRWHIEVKSVGQMFNAVYAVIRLHYLNPVSMEWEYHDGVGAANVQLDAASEASNLGAIKAAAVQMALPSAKSYAIKDAAEHIGTIFGRDLNRRDILQFSGKYIQEREDIPGHTPQTAGTSKTTATATASKQTSSLNNDLEL